MIPKRFQHNPSAIATYDFTEIASGEGIINLYGGSIYTTHLLRSNVFYSNDVSTFEVCTGIGVNFAQFVTEDYDVLFNQPTIINGDILLTASVGWCAVPQNANTCTDYISGSIILVDVAAAETSLGTFESEHYSIGGVGIAAKTRAVKVSVDNQNIKVGEKIRLRIVYNAKRTAGVDAIHGGWGQDPKDRDDTKTAKLHDDYTSQLILQLPVKIDL